MARPSTPPTAANPQAPRARSGSAGRRRAAQGAAEGSDVLVSAVLSTYLLTHLHHVLQRAEYGAQQKGEQALAANYAQLRKVLCLDARSLEDASAGGSDDDGQTQAA